MSCEERYEYSCDHAHRRVRVRLGPDATSDDFMKVIDRQVADKAWTYGALYDLRDRTPGPAPAAVRVAVYLGLYARTLGARGPVAIVSPDVAATGRVLTPGKPLGFRTGVFSDPSAAERWLDGG